MMQVERQIYGDFGAVAAWISGLGRVVGAEFNSSTRVRMTHNYHIVSTVATSNLKERKKERKKAKVFLKFWITLCFDNNRHVDEQAGKV
jgi:hypothetical protein